MTELNHQTGSDSGIDSLTINLLQYNMNHNKRGICLIISNMNFNENLKLNFRDGSMVDAENLRTLFTELNFEVIQIEDATKDEMINNIKDVSQNYNDHIDSDTFVLVILTHGKDDKNIFAIDSLVPIDELIEPLKGHNCQSLADKPKIIIIQACRGKKYDLGVMINGEKFEADADPLDEEIYQIKIPVEANFIFIYSTVSGHVSFLNNKRGSCFIGAFTKIFDKYKYSLEFTRILTLVNMEVSKFESKPNLRNPEIGYKKQASAFTSSLIKELYFTPKC